MHLFFILEKLFPGCVEYETRDNRRFSSSGRPMTSDIIIKIDGAIIRVEYHGPQHRKPVALYGGDEGHCDTSKRDQEKRSTQHNLIEISDDEWDGSLKYILNLFGPLIEFQDAA